jgi:hypothetical protein
MTQKLDIGLLMLNAIGLFTLSMASNSSTTFHLMAIPYLILIVFAIKFKAFIIINQKPMNALFAIYCLSIVASLMVLINNILTHFQ